MRLKYEFETVELNDHFIAVPVGDDTDKYHGVLKLNDTALSILNLRKEEITVDEIVEKLADRYDASPELIRNDVEKYVTLFVERGIL